MPLYDIPGPVFRIAGVASIAAGVLMTAGFILLERGRLFAEAWGSRFVNIGAAGHIDSASGLGPWSRGKTLLADLLINAMPRADADTAPETGLRRSGLKPKQ